MQVRERVKMNVHLRPSNVGFMLYHISICIPSTRVSVSLFYDLFPGTCLSRSSANFKVHDGRMEKLSYMNVKSFKTLFLSPILFVWHFQAIRFKLHASEAAIRACLLRQSNSRNRAAWDSLRICFHHRLRWERNKKDWLFTGILPLSQFKTLVPTIWYAGIYFPFPFISEMMISYHFKYPLSFNPIVGSRETGLSVLFRLMIGYFDAQQPGRYIQRMNYLERFHFEKKENWIK